MYPCKMSRRRFMRTMAVAAAGLAVGGCRMQELAPTVAPTLPPATPTLTPPPTLAQVAIARAETYDRALVRQQVETLLDGLGGLADVVRPGDRVAIKVNLTGGLNFAPPEGLTAVESHLTHPEVVRALGELLRDAGAGEITIVEAVYDSESYWLFGYQDVAEGLGAALIDLNVPDPYPDMAATEVGPDWFVYERFAFNRILEEVDAFISVAKMKAHCVCGVTNSMKNLVGLLPVSQYRLSEEDWWRSALHGESEEEAGTRVPGAILDLNRARPIHLALIDGIMSGDGGEVPRGDFAPVSPGVLLAGKNPVATDAVATAVMGFDPTASSYYEPFVYCENYLNAARELGLGTNRLEEIEVVGSPIDEVVYPFRPCR